MRMTYELKPEKKPKVICYEMEGYILLVLNQALKE